MSKVFTGEVKAKVVEARFALSGKVAQVVKQAGDMVNKGGLLASLDRKILQAELDSQLADFEKVRADFEIFNLGKGEPTDELGKYLKVGKQAQLNVSVKDVELAKARLDQADLFSPVAGVILDDSMVAAGVYITPASSSYKIIDSSSFYFEIALEQKDIPFFAGSRQGTIAIEGMGSIFGTSGPVLSDGKKFFVRLAIAVGQNILLGLNGEASFEE